jgi:hypothetical protein
VGCRGRGCGRADWRLAYTAVGGVINYDIAEYNALIRFKANTTAFSQNGVVAKLFVLTLAKKLF